MARVPLTGVFELRDRTIDSLKGFLILCVILGHFDVNYFMGVGQWSSLFGELISWLKSFLSVYYFHLPLFLGASIFFVRKISLNYFYKRVLTILLPFVFWLIRPSVFFQPIADVSLLFTHYNLRSILWGDWSHIGSILWFLPLVFTCNILFSIFLKLKETKFYHKMLFTIITAFTLEFIYVEKVAYWHVSGYIPYSLDLAVFLFPYFLALWWSYSLISKYRSKINLSYQVILFLLSMPLAYASKLLITKYEAVKTISPFHYRIDLAQFSVPYTVIGYLAMTGLSVAILMFFMFGRIKVFEKIGQNSLPIYLLHYIVLGKLSRLLISVDINIVYLDEWVKLVLGISYFIAAFCIPMLLAHILRKVFTNVKYLGF